MPNTENPTSESRQGSSGLGCGAECKEVRSKLDRLQSTPPSQSLVDWLFGSVADTLGKITLEKIIYFLTFLALSATIGYWSVPSRSWPLEVGVVIIDNVEHVIEPGEAQFVLPRPFFFWEKHRVVGLPGGDVLVDPACPCRPSSSPVSLRGVT